MNEQDFIRKLKKEARFTHTGHQKEILWGRLQSYIDTPSSGGFWHFSFRLAYLAAIVFGVLLTSAGVTFASQGSLPGQTLYPVKRWSEEAVIFVKFDQAEKKRARVELTKKRVEEVNEIVDEDPEKAEEILTEYEGEIQDYIDDPELKETWDNTQNYNKEVLMQTVDQAPDNMKVRIKILIGENEDNIDDKNQGEVDGVETKSSGQKETESGAGGNKMRTSGTSSPQP